MIFLPKDLKLLSYLNIKQRYKGTWASEWLHSLTSDYKHNTNDSHVCILRENISLYNGGDCKYQRSNGDCVSWLYIGFLYMVPGS